MSSSLDFLLQKNEVLIQKSELKGKEFAQGQHEYELIGYDVSKTSFLGFPVKETILRFPPNRPLEYAFCLIDYELVENKYKRIKDIHKSLLNEISKRLGKPIGENSFTFPNHRKIDCRYWQNSFHRLYLISRLVRDPNGNDAAFVAIRWELLRQTPCNFRKWFSPSRKTAYVSSQSRQSKILSVPMRHQYPGTGGCWFTTISRQLLCLNSQWEPIFVFVGFASGEAEAAKKLGADYGFQYTPVNIHDKSEAISLCIKNIEKYNSIANAKKLPTIRMNKDENNNTFFWGEGFDSVYVPTWNQICGKPKGFSKFKTMVIDSIEAGVPIGWTVARHSGRGNHRRMLVGYDLKQQIFYYSDSWGLSSDLKKVPMTAAFCETLWLQIIVSNKRD